MNPEHNRAILELMLQTNINPCVYYLDRAFTSWEMRGMINYRKRVAHRNCYEYILAILKECYPGEHFSEAYVQDILHERARARGFERY